MFEGCGKVFVGRRDNLLSHQRDKGHLGSAAVPASFPAASSLVVGGDEFVMEDV